LFSLINLTSSSGDYANKIPAAARIKDAKIHNALLKFAEEISILIFTRREIPNRDSNLGTVD